MFRKFTLFLSCAVLLSACCSSGDGYRIKDGVIVFDEPAPAKGQEDMLLFIMVINVTKYWMQMPSPYSRKRESLTRK